MENTSDAPGGAGGAAFTIAFVLLLLIVLATSIPEI